MRIAEAVKTHQRGVQWKQGVVICMMSYASLLCNTTPIHCTPLPLHPLCMCTYIYIYIYILYMMCNFALFSRSLLLGFGVSSGEFRGLCFQTLPNPVMNTQAGRVFAVRHLHYEGRGQAVLRAGNFVISLRSLCADSSPPQVNLHDTRRFISQWGSDGLRKSPQLAGVLVYVDRILRRFAEDRLNYY